MIQMLAGLITYLLLAIYCHEQHGEPVSIRRVRQLRNQILNEARMEQPLVHGLQGRIDPANHTCKSLTGHY